MPLKEYDAIRLRDEIAGTLGNRDAIETADRKRTPARDKVAQYIQENVVENDRWPMDMTTLADETDYSRQLVSEVVQDYFVGVDDADDRGPMPTNKDSPMTASPELPQDVERIANGDGDGIYALIDGNYRQIQINVPDDIQNPTEYIRGYLDGRQA